MENSDPVIDRYAGVVAVLDDARFAVPPAAGGPPASLAWLRRTVCRFSEGAEHGRRRTIVMDALDTIDPARLRRRARDLVRAGGDPYDVPFLALGEALGVTDLDALARAVPAAASGYLTGQGRDDADAAVAVLVRLLGPGPDEVVAGRIAVLLQASEATAALVRTALPYTRRPESRGRPVEDVIAEVLRYDPPVPAMRRIATEDVQLDGRTIAKGAVVTLDLRAANRDPAVFEEPGRFDPGRRERPHLTFGAGRRPCPGTGHALQLAAGVLEAGLSDTGLTGTGGHGKEGVR
ncbi:cytochrome P450 [Actinomadura darangshiensis]|uniref:cytochrome P450 n=1 Tax=Actinomadura darangshiensis TaxID=705336 RepID=UPI0014091CD8|nr:cytochrome P450 [Actinomadura darangshiensis]